MKYVNQIIPILKNFGVVKAAIFGSVARGEDTPQSDIDILVKIGRNIDLLEYAGLKVELEEKLGKKVDLVQYDNIKPMLKSYIMKDAISLSL